MHPHSPHRPVASDSMRGRSLAGYRSVSETVSVYPSFLARCSRLRRHVPPQEVDLLGDEALERRPEVGCEVPYGGGP